MKLSFIFAFTASIIAALLGSFFYVSEGAPFRRPLEAAGIKAYYTEREAMMASPCLVAERSGASPDECFRRIRADEGRSHVILWGDSHAGQLAPVLRERLSGSREFTQLTKRSCPPILTKNLFPRDALREKCPAFNERAMEIVSSARPGSTVILAARWDAITSGELRFGHGSGMPSVQDSLAEATRSLHQVIETLEGRGVRVIIVAQTPFPGKNLVGCLAVAKFNHLDQSPCSRFEIRNGSVEAEVLSFLRAASAGYDIPIIRPWAMLCGPRWCQAVGSEGLLYLDATHLSRAGAARVVKSIVADLEAADQRSRSQKPAS